MICQPIQQSQHTTMNDIMLPHTQTHAHMPQCVPILLYMPIHYRQHCSIWAYSKTFIFINIDLNRNKWNGRMMYRIILTLEYNNIHLTYTSYSCTDLIYTYTCKCNVIYVII